MESIKRYYNFDSSIYKLLHEIKNPLTVVSGYLELMEDGSNNDKFYKIIEEEIKRTLSIIKEYSTPKEIEKEEVELSFLLENIKDSLEELYKKNHTKIILLGKEDIYLDTNYDKCKQIFLNIIKNSYEARNNQPLEIKINWYQKDNKTICTIEDNGIGMTKEELSHVEEEFYTTKENGTGLGIPLIKEMMKQLGGTIFYESERNKGTKVILTF